MGLIVLRPEFRAGENWASSRPGWHRAAPLRRTPPEPHGELIPLRPLQDDELPPAPIEKIIFKPVTELQTRLSQLLAGNVDLVYDFALQEVPRMQADRLV